MNQKKKVVPAKINALPAKILQTNYSSQIEAKSTKNYHGGMVRLKQKKKAVPVKINAVSAKISQNKLQ